MPDDAEKNLSKEAGSNACSVGFIARKDGQAGHDVIQKAIAAKASTFHRGGYAADGKTTDGDGLETEIAEDFFRDQYQKLGGQVSDDQRMAVGQLFLPRDENLREQAWAIIEEELANAGISGTIRRGTPVNTDVLGLIAQETMPHPAQILFPVDIDESQRLSIEKNLECAHQRMNSRFQEAGLNGEEPNATHIASMSGDRIIYKGRSDPRDNAAVWPDLHDKNYKSRWAKMHNRFTTAGQTRIENIQPLPGGAAHNGTITTQQGLTNAVGYHENTLAALFGEGGQDLLPLARPGASDSALIDRIATAQRLSGASLPRTKMTLLPKGKNRGMDVSEGVHDARRYLANDMETADGPALFMINDGREILVALDANGSRPAAIQETDEYYAVGSEAGMWNFDLKTELTNTDTLKAGDMLSFDTHTGTVTHDKDLEESVAAETDFSALNARIKDIQIDKSELPERAWDDKELSMRLRHAGITKEDVKVLVDTMTKTGTEGNASMGETSITRGAGSHRERGGDFYTFLHNQIVAPAHNADLDPEMMDLSARFSYPLNRDGTPKEETHVIPGRFVLGSKMLDQTVDQIGQDNFVTIDCTFDVENETYDGTLDRIEKEASEAAKAGKHIILSDENISAERMPVFMEHATGAAHTKLNKEHTRGDVGIVVKSSECNSSHEAGLLKLMGATVVVPYLTEQQILKMVEDKLLENKQGEEISTEEALDNYFKAIDKGVKIIMQRTLVLSANTAQGANLIEANGLDRDLVARIHPGVASPSGGLDGDTLQQRLRVFHDEIFAAEGLTLSRVFDADGNAKMENGGRWIKFNNGIEHGNPSASINALRASLGISSPGQEEKDYDPENGWRLWQTQYLQHARGDHRPVYNIDGLSIDTDGITPLDPVKDGLPTPQELAAEVVVSGGMSVGAISLGAHKDIHPAANKIGFQSNTGEGGYPQELLDTDFMPKIVQWSTNAYGIRPELLKKAEVIEFKFGQGAKSGEGGNMPGEKVTPLLSKLRFIPEGKEQQSSPLHMDMRSIEDLKQKIKLALRANPDAEIRIKIVTKDGCDHEALGAVKAMKNAIEELEAVGVKTSGKMSVHLAGRRGGTASAKPNSIRGSGSDWETYLPLVHKTLTENGFRDETTLIVDGGFAHGTDMAKALILGADKVGFGTLFMEAIGCTMQKQCQTGSCMTDVAVAKTKEELTNYVGKSEYVERLALMLGQDLQRVMASVGAKNTDELKGRTDLLKHNAFATDNGRDYTQSLADGYAPETGSHFKGPKKPLTEFKSAPDVSVDHKLLATPGLVMNGGEFPITANNKFDGVGATISGEVAEYLLERTKSLNEGELKQILPDDHIHIKAEGTLGYASGALLPQGVSVTAHGMAGDSFGTNIRGGIATVEYPTGLKIGEDIHKSAVLVQAMAGSFMTGGEVHIGGSAGNDTAFRQSGGLVVVRGAGKSAQFKTRGTFIAWKDGVDDGSFASHMGGESFIRQEGIKAIYLVKTFAKQQPKVHFEQLQDPEAKERLRDHLKRSYTRTQDPALLELLQKDDWDSVAGEFMHVRTFSAAANDDGQHEPDIPEHYYDKPEIKGVA